MHVSGMDIEARAVDAGGAVKPRVLIMIATSVLGGPGKGLLQFVRNAPAQRMSYTLASFAGSGDARSEFAEVARQQRIRLHLLRQRWMLDPSMIWQADALLEKYNCNIIQSHGYKSHVIGFALSRLRGVPWVAVAHGWTSENFKIQCYNGLDRFLLRYADVAVAVSPRLHETVASLRGAGRTTELVLNAVDASEIRGQRGGRYVRGILGLADDAIVIGVFGRFSPEKGQIHAVEAFARLAARHPRAVLMLVGAGQDEAALRRRVRQEGLDGRVLFCGYQSTPRDYFEACDLVLLPSLSEGLPNVVLEAMALGRPVLATDVGGVREIIRPGETGWIVEPGSSEALANALEPLIDGRVNLAARGNAARNSLFPKFAVDTRVNRLVSIYEGLCARRPATRRPSRGRQCKEADRP
ncbi:MAG: glycosyltransferase [Aquisalimonadaceae bacterium]